MKIQSFIVLFICFSILGCREEKEIPITKLVNPKIEAVAGDTIPRIFTPYGNLHISPEFYDHKFSALTHSYHKIKDTSALPCVRFTPTTRLPQPQENMSPVHFSSAFTREQMEVGYYKVMLNNGTQIEASLSKHCGMHSYQFPQGGAYGIILNLCTPGQADSTQQTVIQKISNRTIQGYHASNNNSPGNRIYFYIEFSQDIKILNTDSAKEVAINTETNLKYHRAWIDFGMTTNKIFAKISLSDQSIAEARNYLQAEIPHWSFDKVNRDAKLQWKKLLSHVKIKSNDTTALQNFYSALYHAYPVLFLHFDIKENYKNSDGEPQDIYNYLQKHTKKATEHVLSSIGLIPMKEYTNQYQLSKPQFSRIILKLEQDRRFTIKTNKNNNTDTPSIMLNGRPLQRTWITRSEITQGGSLEFILTNEQEK